MIEKLNSKSRNPEVDAVCKRIIGTYKKTSLQSDPHLVSVFSRLDTQSMRLTEAIKRTKAESELEQKDEVRDTLTRSFYYLILGFTHHPSPEIKDAAFKVKIVFDKYGVALVDESYAVESSLIVSLLGDLAAAEIQEAIALLSGCGEIIEAIRNAQADFEATRISFEHEKALDGAKENATTIKKEVLELINNILVYYLRAMVSLDEPTYGAFVRTVAAIISDNNIVVKKRSNKIQLA